VCVNEYEPTGEVYWEVAHGSSFPDLPGYRIDILVNHKIKEIYEVKLFPGDTETQLARYEGELEALGLPRARGLQLLKEHWGWGYRAAGKSWVTWAGGPGVVWFTTVGSQSEIRRTVKRLSGEEQRGFKHGLHALYDRRGLLGFATSFIQWIDDYAPELMKAVESGA
jgi:hypothetical protein